MSLLTDIFCKNRRFVYVVLLSSVLIACSHGPVASSRVSQYFDFNSAQHYFMYARGSKLFQQQNIADEMRNVVELVIERQLENRSLQFVPKDKSDVIFTYHLINNDPQSLVKYNQFVHLCVRCGVDKPEQRNHPESNNEKRPQQQKQHQQRSKNNKERRSNINFLPKGIIIDAIDPKTSRTVWRAQQPVNIAIDDNSLQTKRKLEQAIALAFNQYPVTKQHK